MVANLVSEDRIHNALLHGLSLSLADFASNASQLHALVATVLSVQASYVLRSHNNGSAGKGSSISKSDQTSKQLRLATLAVFHKLSGLQNGNPITLSSLHDFIIAYTAPASATAAEEARLARRIVESLFRKKPSLVRALENQLVPAWSDMMTAFNATDDEAWLVEAQSLTASIYAMSKFTLVRELLQSSASAPAFWTAFQAFYDIALPKLLSSRMPSGTQSLSQLSEIKEYTNFRKDLVDFFASFFPALSAEILTECLENEASNPDMPNNLSDLPLTSLVNMTLLQDAEYYHHVSRRVGLRKPAAGKTSSEERTYIQNALDFSKTLSKESISDGVAAVSKGKGKATSNGDDDAASAQQKLASMTSQVLGILPDASVESIRRLLGSSALEQVADEQKVERIVGMLLEGDQPVEEAGSHEVKYEELDVPPTEAPKQSSFASVRRNVFSDSLDTSRLHRGKQDFKDDTFLSSELRASILAAAERQAQESDEEDEDEADEAFAEVDEAGEALATIKVKDDVSEESGLDDDDESKSADSSRAGTPSTSNATRPSSAPSLGATGVPKELEKLYIATYTKDTAVFTREAKKSPARAELKKKIAALRLPQSISDEQIEGWARMLERNPKKDKILERLNDKLFSGNQKGQDVNTSASTTEQKAKSHHQGGQDSARGGYGERGRGRGRGRSRQSDQRRRGHDRKMQKAGI